MFSAAVVLAALVLPSAVEAQWFRREPKAPEAPPVAFPWAKPLDGGPIRAVMLAPRSGAWDGALLAAQLDLELTTVEVWRPDALWAPEPVEGGDSEAPAGMTRGGVLERISEGLAKPSDLIILANIEPDAVPGELRDALAGAAGAGTGLLIAGHGGAWTQALPGWWDLAGPEVDTAMLALGFGEDLLPEWLQGFLFVQPFELGSGRIVLADFPGPPPAGHALLPALEDPAQATADLRGALWSFWARAACWAAKREPEATIAAVLDVGPEGPPEDEVMPGLPQEYIDAQYSMAQAQPFRTYVLALDRPAGRAYSVRVRLRTPGRAWELTNEYTTQMAPGADTYTFTLNAGAGTYFVDMWLLHRGRIAYWHTEVLHVDAWPDFSELAFSQGVLRPHDSLGIQLNLAPYAAAGAPYQRHAVTGCTVYARAVDAYGRRVAEASVPAGLQGGPVQVVLEFADLISPYVNVEVFVTPYEGTAFTSEQLHRAAYGSARLPVVGARRGASFPLLVRVPAWPEFGFMERATRWAELGADAAVLPANQTLAMRLAEHGLEVVPELTAIVPKHISADAVRTPTFSAADYLDSELRKVREALASLGAVQPPYFSLGHGNCIAPGVDNACQAAPSLVNFRLVMQNAYHTLAALNQAWGANYSDWDEVRPLSAADAFERGQFAPFVAFRRYMDSAFAAVHRHVADTVYDLVPAARTGFSTPLADRLYQGYDWSQLASLDFVAAPLDPLTMAQIRAFRGANTFACVAVDSPEALGSEVRARWLPWFAALHGFGGVLLCDSSGNHRQPPGYFMADGAPAPPLEALLDSIKLLDEGLAELLLAVERGPAPVALYVSRPSAFLNHAETSFGQPEDGAERVWLQWLKRLGCQVDIVGPQDARAGRLERHRLLVLPMARALHDDEVRAIQEFAAQGGALLADLAPGQFDAYGVRRDAPPFGAEFGVAWDKVEAGPPAEAGVRLGEGSASIKGELGAVQADTGVQLGHAVPGGLAGVSPIWTVLRDEDRFGVLANHVMPAPDSLDPETRQLIEGMLIAVLAEADVRPAADAEARGGGLASLEVMQGRWQHAEITAFLNGPRAEQRRFTVSLEGKGEVHNVLTGAHISRPDRINLTIPPGEAAVFAALPYTLQDFSVTAGEAAPGQRISLQVRVKARDRLPQEHLVHLKVFGPDGAPIPHYAQTIRCPEGEGLAYVPLARNEEPGLYRIVARDLLTGATAEAAAKVAGPDDAAVRHPNEPRGR